MKGEKWTAAKVDYLRSNHGLMSRTRLCAHLGVGRWALDSKIAELGLYRGSARWTDEEIRFIMKNSGIMPCEDIASEILRSPEVIRNKIKKLNLPLYEEQFESAVYSPDRAKKQAKEKYEEKLRKIDYLESRYLETLDSRLLSEIHALSAYCNAFLKRNTPSKGNKKYDPWDYKVG